MAFQQLRENINEYAKDKTWYWHVPLWLLGVYLFFELLSFNLIDPQPFALSVMHAFDFTLHEIAHVFTAWLPPLVTAAAGSASELILGALLVYGGFKFRNYFGVLFCCLWMMLVCMATGHYMADAVPQQIQLVSLGASLAGGETVIHDWYFIFGELGLLGSSGAIGGMVKAIGVLFGLFGLVFSVFIVFKMAVTDKKEKEEKAAAEALAKTPDGKVPIYPDATRGSLSHPSPGEPPKEDNKQQ